jgi:hypothetical protein
MAQCQEIWNLATKAQALRTPERSRRYELQAELTASPMLQQEQSTSRPQRQEDPTKPSSRCQWIKVLALPSRLMSFGGSVALNGGTEFG